MFKFDMKVEVKINNEVKAGTVYDFTADQKTIWVETAEDIYVVPATEVTIVVAPAKHPRKVASGSLEFSTTITEDMFGDREARYQTAFLTVKSNKLSAREVEELFDRASELMLAELDGVVDCSIAGCPCVEDNYYGDGLEFTADHGSITEAKAEIKKAWRAVKAQLGLR